MHKAEGRYRDDGDWPERRRAHLAEQGEGEYDWEDHDYEGDDELSAGATGVAGELGQLQEGAQNGDEAAEEQLAMLSERLAAAQAAFAAGRDLRDLKSSCRRGDRKCVAGGRGACEEMSEECKESTSPRRRRAAEREGNLGAGRATPSARATAARRPRMLSEGRQEQGQGRRKALQDENELFRGTRRPTG